MIAAMMIYVTVVGALSVVAADAGERMLRLLRRPARAAWVAGILLMCTVPLVGPGKSNEQIGPARTNRASSRASAETQTPVAIGSSVRAAIQPRLAVSSTSMLKRLDRPMLALWIAGSIAWGLLVIGSVLFLRLKARGWEPIVLDGIPVLLSHSTGPALVGVISPQIVLPRWVVDLPADKRRLLLAHERQHAQSRDPLMLLFAAVIVIAMPWNCALWYALVRLKLAVEADCDQRVLHRSVDITTYGSLLLDVSERTLTGAPLVAALAEPATNLGRRIALMKRVQPKFGALRAVGAAALSLLAITLACQTPKPALAPTPSGAVEANSGALRNHVEYRVTVTPGSYEPLVSDSALRAAVSTYYPAALTGGMGSHPFLWFLADSTGKVIRTATGREGLSHWSYAYLRDSMPSYLLNMTPTSKGEVEAHGIDYLDSAAAQRKFPSEQNFSAFMMTSVKGTPIDAAWIQIGTRRVRTLQSTRY